MSRSEPFQELAETLRFAVATLRDAGIPFLLGGSLAAWARGGPTTQNDLDLMVKPEDAEAALAALVQSGMRQEPVPEEWLLKVWHGDVMVDIIFCPTGLEMTDEVIARGETIPVLSVATTVMALEDVLVTKLLSFDEHAVDYSSVLAIARSLREQIDWQSLETRTHGSPFAAAFFTLVRGLGIAPPAEVGAAASTGHGGAPPGVGRVSVRVVPGAA